MELKRKRLLFYLVCLALLGVSGGLVFVKWQAFRHLAMAEWVCVHTREVIQTNAVGQVIQPKAKPILECYADPKSWPTDYLEAALAPASRQQLVERCLAKYPISCASNVVIDAFSSAAYAMTDEPIPIIRLSVRSQEAEIALAVLTVLMEEVKHRDDESRQMCLDRALIGFRQKIERAKLRGEEVMNCEQREMEIRANAERHWYRVYTLSEPHIVK